MSVNIRNSKRKFQIVEDFLGAILDSILLNVDWEPYLIASAVLATIQVNYRRCDDGNNIVKNIRRKIDRTALVSDATFNIPGPHDIGEVQSVDIIILRHLIGAELVLILLVSFLEQKVLEIAVAVNPSEVVSGGLIADLKIDKSYILSGLKECVVKGPVEHRHHPIFL